ncbi:uncharacterized protein BJ212DRAFT_1573685 [Suillus subaureus]|uniref:DUF6532 domain-containing protein n=1 Tax=Suillus subaureus TaxID=48587 RepID=A0A9P7EKL0_9AGAM|nr:uncharacterized protein BJ212DRAFT_1573685 [Suillus subaureus]KAG1824374.1 hypothetical protein BJ212DRAFT_1573685 [Suillus subaureus]
MGVVHVSSNASHLVTNLTLDNQAGSSKDVTPKHPMAKDLPSQPLPPLNTAATGSTVPASPTQSPSDTVPVPVPHQQQHPIPIPANHMEEIKTSTRSRMQCMVLTLNGMPSNDENIQMAHNAILQAMQIFPHQAITISPERRRSSVHSQKSLTPSALHSNMSHMLSCNTNTILSLIFMTHHWKSRTSYKWCLCSSQTSNILDGNLQSIVVLEHEVLVSVVMEVLWTKGFYEDIDFKDPEALNSIIALGGTIIWSAIKEYETGMFKHVDFSTAKSKDIYHNILTHIHNKIDPYPKLTAHFKALKTRMSVCRKERLGL